MICVSTHRAGASGFLLGVILFATALTARGQERANDQPTENEIREAREVGERFSERLRQTRDLQPLIDEFFVSDFVNSGLKDPFWGRSVNVNAPTDAHLTDKQLLRWYTLRFSIVYAERMYWAGKMSLDDLGKYLEAHDPKAEAAMLPEELVAYSKSLRIPTGKEPVDELVQFAFSTREQTLKILQNELTKHPPEITPEFRQNLDAFAKHAGDAANPWGQVKVSVESEARSGRPAGTRFLRLEVPFHLGLILVKDGNKLRVWFAASVIPDD